MVAANLFPLGITFTEDEGAVAFVVEPDGLGRGALVLQPLDGRSATRVAGDGGVQQVGRVRGAETLCSADGDPDNVVLGPLWLADVASGSPPRLVDRDTHLDFIVAPGENEVVYRRPDGIVITPLSR